MKLAHVFRMLMLLCTLLALTPGYASDGHKYGQSLVASYTLPPEVINKMQALKPAAKDPHKSAMENALLADSVDWIGPERAYISQGNPYTVVIRVKAHAVADGAAVSLWLGGWNYSENNNGPVSRTKPVATLTEPKARAGQSLELVGTAGPVSFKTDRTAAPTVSLNRLDNMVIDQVVVDVWTGMASNGIVGTFLSMQWLLIGLVMLALWWFWFKR